MRKHTFYINCLLCSALLLGSCQRTLLYPVPESILTTTNAFNTAKDINLATIGIYNVLQARVPSDYQLMETPTDNAWAAYFASASGIEQLNTLTLSVDNAKLNSFWKDTYNGIFRANSVLANIDIPTDYATSQKDRYIGEAKFMRALFYFDLVRIFGGVPAITSIVTSEESRQIGRATEQEIYNLITSDLQDAISRLPAPSDIEYGRASKGAAVALLAKVYVYLQQWADAKKWLDQLSTEFNYSLVSNYADLFAIATEQNSETIFSVPYVGETNGNILAYDMAPSGGLFEVVSEGSRVIRPAWDLRKAFEDEDSRLPVTIQEQYYPYGHQPGDPLIWFPFFKKWVVPSELRSSGLDVPILRFADMVLLDAEVLYNLDQPQEALDQINKVRERAFQNTAHDYVLADIPTKEDFYDKLLLERRLELANENNRWFDLVRTGRFTTALQDVQTDYNDPDGQGVITKPIHAEPFMKYFPIPNEQIQLGAPGVLTQNEGY